MKPDNNPKASESLAEILQDSLSNHPRLADKQSRLLEKLRGDSAPDQPASVSATEPESSQIDEERRAYQMLAEMTKRQREK